jgi:hypothetical protein
MLCNQPRPTLMLRRVYGRDTDLTSSYDAFFKSRSPVSRLHFIGLCLIGGNLILGGTTILCMLVAALWPLSISKVLVFFLSSMLYALIVYFGLLHLRRAFRK